VWLLTTYLLSFVLSFSPFFNLALATNVAGLVQLFDVYRKYPYEYFIAGHLTHVGTPQDVDLGEEFIIDLLDAGVRAFAESGADPENTANIGVILNDVNLSSGQNAGNVWLLFREYLNQISMLCVDIVLDPSRNLSGRTWVEDLAGVRSTVYSHCKTLANSLRIELPGL
jgi:hypothetical protein